MKSNLLTIIFLSFIVLITICSFALCQQNYYTPENILLFANHLYKNEDYLRAAGEYQRYLFATRTDDSPDSILFKIGNCYRLADRTQEALLWYERIKQDYPQSAFYNQMNYQIALLYFMQKDYDESIKHIQQTIPSLSSANFRLQMNQLWGVNLLFQRQWDNAQQYFSAMTLNDQQRIKDSLTVKLHNFAMQGKKLPRKSKFLAGTLSAMIPGTGKIYAHRTADGLFSLFTIALYTWQAWDGFHKNGTRSIKGWIYGSVGTVFYVGNIYGSVVAAKIYNESVENSFIHKLELELQLSGLMK